MRRHATGTALLTLVLLTWGSATGAVLASAVPRTVETTHQSEGPAVASPDGRYHPSTPRRLLDTRVSGGPIGPGAQRRLVIAGTSGVPLDSWGVLLNVTAVSPTRDTHLTLLREPEYPQGHSFLDVSARETRAAPLLALPNGDKAVYLRNDAGHTNVVVDLVGWFNVGPDSPPGGALFEPVKPKRILDTRTTARPLAAGRDLDLTVDLGGTGWGVTALVLNVTAVGATRGGHLTAWSGSTAPPSTSSLNFPTGTAVANLAIVPTRAVGLQQAFRLHNGGSGRVHVVVDVVGYMDTDAAAGLVMDPTGWYRVADSRAGTGGLSGRLPDGAVRQASAATPWQHSTEDVVGLWATVKAVRPTGNGHLTIWSGRGTEPATSTVNTRRGAVTSNGVTMGMTDARRFAIANHAGTTDVVVDAAGAWKVTPSRSASVTEDVAVLRDGASAFDIGVRPTAYLTP